MLLFTLPFVLPAAAAPDAAKPKPAIAIADKAIGISVVIDPALAAQPALMAKLLAEGRRQATAWKTEADKEYRASPSFFADGRRWSAERRYAQRSVIGPYVSVLRSDDTFFGGAHPNHDVNTLLWDARVAKMISIRPFFKETADNGPTLTALARAARLAVAALKIARMEPNERAGLTPDKVLATDTFIRDGVKPTLIGLGPVTLAPSTEAGKSAGLTIHYPPYAVGAYVEGSFTIFLPWTAFRQYLSPQGAALFGGDRPAGDDTGE